MMYFIRACVEICAVFAFPLKPTHITRWHLSLTHTKRYAAAFALAEGEDGEGVQKSGSESGC
jgi:phosphopantetheinyl transferase (holo-ACP synthase)